MSYCLSIHTNNGLVLCSASHSVKNRAAESDMHQFSWPDNRFITILSAGSRETIQAVLTKINADLKQSATLNLSNTPSLNEATDYIAKLNAQIQKQLKKTSPSVNVAANFIVAGQILNQPMETQLIYAQGNYIHESNKSPFLQIGETKFGKPILDRIVTRDIPLERAGRCALVSMDSMIRSTNTVATPIELLFYKKNAIKASAYLSLDDHNPLFNSISKSWANDITKALDNLPNFHWES